MEVKVIGQMDNTIDHTFESANRVYNTDGLSPTIPTCAGGNIQPKVLEVEVIGGMGEMNSNSGTQYCNQDRVYNTETISPALNVSNVIPNIVDTVMIRQATKDGVVPCRIGGGGRLDLPRLDYTQRASDRERRDLSDSDNGEYP